MKWLIWIVVLAVVLGGGYYFYQNRTAPVQESVENSEDLILDSEEAETGATVDESGMVGVWQSDMDAQFTREFRANGAIIDRYDGDESAESTGVWTVIDPAAESVPGVPAASLAGTAVVKVVWEGGVEVMYFSVNSLTATTLMTTDLSGVGRITTYTKVQ